MPNMTPAETAGEATTSGLVKARRRINAARERGATPSDGGGTGRTDSND